MAFVPAVLLCALVRICSQRRQLDFATIDGDLHALEAVDITEAGVGLRRPRSLPAFENIGSKKGFPTTLRGGKFFPGPLRRSRSTEDFLPHPSIRGETFVLKPLKYDENIAGKYSHFLLTDDALRDNGSMEKNDNCNFQISTVLKRNPVNRMLMSCWSGDFSVSSLTNSSSTANSPAARHVVGVDGEGGEDDCDVCRQMLRSSMIMSSEENGNSGGASNTRVSLSLLLF